MRLVLITTLLCLSLFSVGCAPNLQIASPEVRPKVMNGEITFNFAEDTSAVAYIELTTGQRLTPNTPEEQQRATFLCRTVGADHALKGKNAVTGNYICMLDKETLKQIFSLPETAVEMCANLGMQFKELTATSFSCKIMITGRKPNQV